MSGGARDHELRLYIRWYLEQGSTPTPGVLATQMGLERLSGWHYRILREELDLWRASRPQSSAL